KSREKKLITLEEARANRTPINWANYMPPRPAFAGTRVYSSVIPSEVEEPRGTTIGVTTRDPSNPLRSAQDDTLLSLDDLIPYIDWSPFFHTWDLRARYPAIF